jgi:hypothetical protein
MVGRQAQEWYVERIQRASDGTLSWNPLLEQRHPNLTHARDRTAQFEEHEVCCSRNAKSARLSRNVLCSVLGWSV